MAIADIENEIHKLVEHAKQIETEVLPATFDGLKQFEGLAGNPVVVSVLKAEHVPTEALDVAVKVIDGLEELYKPETAVAPPAAPVAPEVPEVPAEAPTEPAVAS